MKALQTQDQEAKKVVLAFLEILELPPKTSITSHQFAGLMAGMKPESIPQDNLERAREYMVGIKRRDLDRVSQAASKFYDGVRAIIRYYDEKEAKEA